MSKNSRKNLSEVFDFLGEVLAFIAIAILAFVVINGAFGIITDPQVLNILNICKTYAGLALIIVVGFEATIKRSFIIRIIFYVLVAIVIIFQFFPGAWEQVVGYIK